MRNEEMSAMPLISTIRGAKGFLRSQTKDGLEDVRPES